MLGEPEELRKLYDAAFAFAKDSTAGLYARAARRATRQAISLQFPDASRADVACACRAADGLLRACYDIGDACRNEKMTRAEAVRDLREPFLGFSEAVYEQALSYGMYISR